MPIAEVTHCCRRWNTQLIFEELTKLLVAFDQAKDFAPQDESILSSRNASRRVHAQFLLLYSQQQQQQEKSPSVTTGASSTTAASPPLLPSTEEEKWLLESLLQLLTAVRTLCAQPSDSAATTASRNVLLHRRPCGLVLTEVLALLLSLLQGLDHDDDDDPMRRQQQASNTTPAALLSNGLAENRLIRALRQQQQQQQQCAVAPWGTSSLGFGRTISLQDAEEQNDERRPRRTPSNNNDKVAWKGKRQFAKRTASLLADILRGVITAPDTSADAAWWTEVSLNVVELFTTTNSDPLARATRCGRIELVRAELMRALGWATTSSSSASEDLLATQPTKSQKPSSKHNSSDATVRQWIEFLGRNHTKTGRLVLSLARRDLCLTLLRFASVTAVSTPLDWDDGVGELTEQSNAPWDAMVCLQVAERWSSLVCSSDDGLAYRACDASCQWIIRALGSRGRTRLWQEKGLSLWRYVAMLAGRCASSSMESPDASVAATSSEPTAMQLWRSAIESWCACMYTLDASYASHFEMIRSTVPDVAHEVQHIRRCILSFMVKLLGKHARRLHKLHCSASTRRPHNSTATSCVLPFSSVRMPAARSTSELPETGLWIPLHVEEELHALSSCVACLSPSLTTRRDTHPGGGSGGDSLSSTHEDDASIDKPTVAIWENDVIGVLLEVALYQAGSTTGGVAPKHRHRDPLLRVTTSAEDEEGSGSPQSPPRHASPRWVQSFVRILSASHDLMLLHQQRPSNGKTKKPCNGDQREEQANQERLRQLDVMRRRQEHRLLSYVPHAPPHSPPKAGTPHQLPGAAAAANGAAMTGRRGVFPPPLPTPTAERRGSGGDDGRTPLLSPADMQVLERLLVVGRVGFATCGLLTLAAFRCPALSEQQQEERHYLGLRVHHKKWRMRLSSQGGGGGGDGDEAEEHVLRFETFNDIECLLNALVAV